MSTNTINIDGYLSRDGELKFTQSGQAYLRLTIPDSKQTKDGAGNWVDVDGYVTTWFNVTVWGKDAEHLSERAVKGARVKASGRLLSRTYESNGETRTQLELDYPAVRIEEKRDRQSGGGLQQQSGQQSAQGDPWGGSDAAPF